MNFVYICYYWKTFLQGVTPAQNSTTYVGAISYVVRLDAILTDSVPVTLYEICSVPDQYGMSQDIVFKMPERCPVCKGKIYMMKDLVIHKGKSAHYYYCENGHWWVRRINR